MSVTGPGKCDVREGPGFNAAVARGLVVHVASISSSGMPTSSLSFINSVTDDASSTQLLAASASRLTWSVFNDSSQVLYLAFGANNASTTAYTVQIQPGGYYEPPAAPVAWTGPVQGIWPGAVGAGAAKVTTHFP
jgi:hypothetical protein